MELDRGERREGGGDRAAADADAAAAKGLARHR